LTIVTTDGTETAEAIVDEGEDVEAGVIAGRDLTN
jgi:hypothetical protein